MEGLTRLARLFRDGKIHGDEHDAVRGCFSLVDGPRIEWDLFHGILVVSQNLHGAKAQILMPVGFAVLTDLDVLEILESLLLDEQG